MKIKIGDMVVVILGVYCGDMGKVFFVDYGLG